MSTGAGRGSGSGSGGEGADDLPFASYLLERRLAVGGMSEVFVARPRGAAGNARRVAVKRLLPELVEDDAIRGAFELEAKLHAGIRHKNVVEFLEYGTYAGEPFIAMELVEGVDLSRILRQAASEEKALSAGMSVHVAREICSALACIHGHKGAGIPGAVVHRDVTPTNVLLSVRGEVKLADFGIARFLGRDLSAGLKGKYAYLAPEQVSGEEFDHRADIFALGVVLSEMLIGGPLFPGAGQLAILLAIRDARIDRLRKAKDRLPRGLCEILEKALSKAPEDRHASALDLSDDIAPFEVPSRSAARAELTGWVAYVRDTTSAARRIEGAVLETRALVASAPRSRRAGPRHTPPASGPPSGRATLPEEPVSCVLRPLVGEVREIGLPKVIEMLVTGQLGPLDQVDLGDGFHPISKLAIFARYLPHSTATTKRLEGPGVPDFTAIVSVQGLLEAFLWVARKRETGVLFADPASDDGPRTELYFERGQLQLATSSEPSTLLGEHLLAQGLIDRAELDLAVLVMHRYNGHIGDTLIALGLAEPLEVFQAIRSQGRDRVAAVFRWTRGQLSFYRGVEPLRNDFRLDLEVPALALAGLEASLDDAQIEALWSDRATETYSAVRPMPDWARVVTWPHNILSVLVGLGNGRRVQELPACVRALGTGERARGLSDADILRALEAAVGLGVATRAPEATVP